MVRASSGALALLAVVSMPQPAYAAQQVTLKPASPWNLDGTDAGCALRRSFGSAERPLIMELRRNGPGHVFQFSASGDELSSLKNAFRVTIRYGDLQSLGAVPFQTGTAERPGQAGAPSIYVSSSLRPTFDDEDDPAQIVTPAMEASVTKVTIEWGRNSVVLATGSLGKAFELMRQCTDSLVESWGLDPKVQNTLSRKPEPISIASWASALQAKYPSGAAAAGKQGRVNFRMLVGADGKPTACVVLRSYNDLAFDKASCATLQVRARFKPALDAAGNPVASYFTSTVIWNTG